MVKGRKCQVVFRSPEELKAVMAEFHHWYNYVHYHERIGNLHPVDKYRGQWPGDPCAPTSVEGVDPAMALSRIAGHTCLMRTSRDQTGQY